MFQTVEIAILYLLKKMADDTKPWFFHFLQQKNGLSDSDETFFVVVKSRKKVYSNINLPSAICRRSNERYKTDFNCLARVFVCYTEDSWTGFHWSGK